MPKFVPVQDNEKPRNEQSLYDESLRKHRQFDDPHSLNKRGWGQGEMGWGVKKVFGSEKDLGAQVVKKNSDQGGKMMKNEKGLWVKVKSQQEEEDTQASGSGTGRGRGGRGLSMMDHLSMSIQQREGGKEVEEEEVRSRFDDPQDHHNNYHDRHSHSESRRRRSGSRSRDHDDDGHYHRSSKRRSSSRSRRHRSRSDSRDNSRTRTRRKTSSRHHHDDDDDRHHSRRSRSRSRSRSEDRHRHRKHYSDVDHSDHRRSSSRGVHHTKDDLTTGSNTNDDKQRCVEDQPLPSSSIREEAGDDGDDDDNGNDEVLEITAIQVVNHFHEVFASSTSQRLDEIANLFLPHASIHSLKSQAVLLNGQNAIRESFQKTKNCKVTVSKRVFIHFQPHRNDKDYDNLVHWLVKEEDDDDVNKGSNNDGSKQVRVVTYVCDLHRQGTSPGLGDRSRDTVLLYECQGALIGRIWGSVDNEHLSQEEDLTPEMFYQSKLWSQVMKIIQERRGGSNSTTSSSLQVERDSFYHNYDRMEVWG
eukprot:gene5043-5537_t